MEISQNLNTNIILIIILILIVFSIIYIYTTQKGNNNNTKITEGFAGNQYVVDAGDVVALNGLDNVRVGNQNPIPLTDAINQLITDANRTALSGYLQTNALNTVNSEINSIKNNLSEINNSITPLPTLQSTLTTQSSDLNRQLTTQLTTVENRLTTLLNNTTSNINTLVNNTIPALTITSYYGDVAPLGWQLCNGEILRAINGNDAVYVNDGTTIKVLKTPNLKGRVIVGHDIGNTTRKIGSVGGAETHSLTIEEMPPHSHKTMPNPDNAHWSGWSMPNWGLLGSANNPNQDVWIPTSSTGGGQPHNNMQPYIILNYIIKKPLNGGSSNPVITFSNNVTDASIYS
jgi:microcystin-dependent protein